ncbi:MAG: hypothetical protein P4L82_05950 [Ancalomicrobiaceae bacterium]|nr:hypothetical protein [Ancalomicrobiaceae bacterium]
MSITSVGASFSYVNPNSVAGPSSAAVKVSDASEQPSPSSPSPQKSDSDASQLSGTGAPQFSADTQAALLKAQEIAQTASPATAASSYKVPFAAET